MSGIEKFSENKNKVFTINNNGDFLALYNRGKSKAHPLIITYVGSRNLGRSRKRSLKKFKNECRDITCRIGITASKKIGNAVERNRARRIVKEAFRLLQPEINTSEQINIVFVARQNTVKASMWQVHKAMRGHLRSLGVIKNGQAGQKE